MIKRVHVIISGRVQGVFFRAETKRVADSLGLKGWVKNRPDGSVEALFEGDETAINRMLKWCWKGPLLARVNNVEVQEEPSEGTLKDFRIIY